MSQSNTALEKVLEEKALLTSKILRLRTDLDYLESDLLDINKEIARLEMGDINEGVDKAYDTFKDESLD